jgi:hypothetical protein
LEIWGLPRQPAQRRGVIGSEKPAKRQNALWLNDRQGEGLVATAMQMVSNRFNPNRVSL